MKVTEAFNLGVFGIPSEYLRVLISNTPFDILKKSFENWSEKEISRLKMNIENEEKLIEQINQGLEK